MIELCKSCGEQLEFGAKYCSHCGAAVATIYQPVPNQIISEVVEDQELLSEEDLDYLASAKKKKALKLVGIISVAVVLVAGGILVFVLTKGGKKPVEKVRIPDVANLQLSEATEQLEALQLIVTLEYKESANVEKDCVIMANPRIGTLVNPGSEVTLIISSGSSEPVVRYKYKEEDAVKFMDLTLSSNYPWMINTARKDLEKELAKAYIFGMMCDDPVDETPGDLSYLSKTEKDYWSKQKDFELNHAVYYKDHVQTIIDDIWGKKAVDLDKWVGKKNPDIIVSETGYIYVLQGYGGPYEVNYYKILGATRKENDTFIVQVQMFDVDYIFNDDGEYNIVDLFNNKEVTLKKRKVYDLWEEGFTFDECIKKLDITSKIGVIEFEVYDSGQGLRLTGRVN